MNRSFLAPASAVLLVLAGCSRSCAGDAPHYGSYVPDFAPPLWSPASYAAVPSNTDREELAIDEHRIGYVVGGERIILTDRATFQTIKGTERIGYVLAVPEDKGFVFVSDTKPVETWFSERFDGPLRSLGKGTPCREMYRTAWVNGPSGCLQRSGVVSSHTGSLVPMAEDLLVLFVDETGEHTRMVSLPSGDPPPKQTPRAEDLFTLQEGGLAFLRGPDGLFVREPGSAAWKRIGGTNVSSLSADESGVVAYGDVGPTRLVEGNIGVPLPRFPDAIAHVTPTTNKRGTFSYGRFDRDTWTQDTRRQFNYPQPDTCTIVGPMHDLLACPAKPLGVLDDEAPARDRILRSLPLPWEALADSAPGAPPEPDYPGMLPSELSPEMEWEGPAGSQAFIRSNEHGILFQGMDCNGAKKRFAICERSGFQWQSTTLSNALDAIPESADVTLFPAPNDVLVFAKESDGSLTLGLGRSGRLRRFARGELPSAVADALAATQGDAGADAGADIPPGFKPINGRAAQPRSKPQFLVTQNRNFRIVGVYGANGKTYSLELSFDGQPQLDTFDGFASFAGPYGLGLHQNGGLFESLDGAHSFLRVPAPPLAKVASANASATDADTDAGADATTLLHCYPAGCRIGEFERRGWGLAAPRSATDAGRDAR